MPVETLTWLGFVNKQDDSTPLLGGPIRDADIERDLPSCHDGHLDGQAGAPASRGQQGSAPSSEGAAPQAELAPR
jgi:hypothetical protein